MEEVGVPQAHAERMHDMMEDTFLESFLALDFPPSHAVREGTVERDYLMEQLQRRGISRAGIERALVRFNEDGNFGGDLRRRRQNGERVTLSTSTLPDAAAPLQQIFDGGDTVVDDQSVFSWRDGSNDAAPSREGQNLLNLLYHIAEDQARRDGYIHRGVTCNSCGAMPIQGIRYRCANCIDYDLCETCEAMQVHIKTHLFYKVRIPAPFLGNPRQSQPVWYPGKPTMLPRSLPRNLAKRLMKVTGFENTELDALWDQFRCLANCEWVDDPNKLHMAIDRKTFDRCFVPNTSIRPPPPSLIYDRMFAFYDTNGDNLIGFEEFLRGLASFNNRSADERMRRIFRGYDLDGDGYVERKDFLRIFRAYYALSRELTRDMVAGMEDDFLEGGARDVVLGSQPISSAFPGTIPSGEPSRTGEGKRFNREGDLEIADNEGVLRRDSTDTGNRYDVIGDAAVRTQFGRERPMFPSTIHFFTRMDAGADNLQQEGDEASDSDGDPSSSSVASDHWPPAEHILDEDVANALGAYVPLQEITDPVDRARIGTVVYNRMHNDDRRRIDEVRRQGIDERWRRRAFYIDEEDGAAAPEGYQRDSDVDDASDDDEDAIDESHPPSPRSRSSSKVRFQDDVTDDCDVRSNPSTSSRSIPVGERWGGFEVPEVERDVGKEILYQVTQQGFNELLDILFKPKENLVMEAYRTREERKTWAREIELFELLRRKMPAGSNGDNNNGNHGIDDATLDDLILRAGFTLKEPAPTTAPSEAVRSEPGMSAPPSISSAQEDDYLRQHQTEQQQPENNNDLVDSTDSTLPRHRHYSELDIIEPSASSQGPSSPDPTLPQHRPNTDELEIPNISPPPLPPNHAHFSFLDNDNDNDNNNENSLSSLYQTLPSFDFENPTTLSPPPPSNQVATNESSSSNPSSFYYNRHPSPPAQLSSSSSYSPVRPPNEHEDGHEHEHGDENADPEGLGHHQPRRPSYRSLARLAYLTRVERESQERGAPGAKLSFEEFASRMNADRGRRLAFVGSWIEMASF